VHCSFPGPLLWLRPHYYQRRNRLGSTECSEIHTGVVPLLSKVKVISARSTYEGMFPESPLKWKFYAFQEKLSKTFSEMKTEKNIISFGDSHVEREAVRAVTRGLPNTRTKSVKFAERPSMEQLRRQIELVTNCFQYIHSHDGDLDLQLTVTVNAPAAPSSPSTSASAPPTTQTLISAPPSSPSDALSADCNSLSLESMVNNTVPNLAQASIKEEVVNS